MPVIKDEMISNPDLLFTKQPDPPATEPPVEPVKEQAPEPAPVTETSPVKEEPPVPEVNYENMYRELELRFADLNTKHKETQTKYEELEAGINPLDYFANENEYRRQQLLKKYPQYDPAILSSVVSDKITKLSPIDLLIKNELLENGDIYANEAEAREVILDKYSISPDDNLDELPTITKNKIKKDAKEAMSKFNSLKDSIEVPQKVDLKAKREQELQDKIKAENAIKAQWQPVMSDIVSRVDKLVFTEKDGKGAEQVYFEFEIDANYRKEAEQSMDVVLANLAQRGIELNADTRKTVTGEIVNALKNGYVAKNFEAMLKSLRNQTIKKVKDEVNKEVHNPRPLRHDETPIDPSRSQNSKEAAENYLMDRFGRRRK